MHELKRTFMNRKKNLRENVMLKNANSTIKIDYNYCINKRQRKRKTLQLNQQVRRIVNRTSEKENR